VTAHGARTTHPWWGPRGSTGSLGFERNDLGEQAGAARLESWPVRQDWSHGRHGGGTARCLCSDIDLGRVVGSRPHGRRGCVCVLRSTGVGTVASARRSRRVDAEWLGGAAGVARVSERPRVRAQERARELEYDPALALPGGRTPRKAVPRLATAERRQAWLGRGYRKKKGRGFSLP
jgi:hypothetical protein